MSDRKPLSKKTRFEVFMRDQFTCQYCGRSAYDTVLEVDHIKPVAEGGTDDTSNLITACFDCNRGKGKTELSDESAITVRKNQLDMLAARREQFDMMYQWQLSLVDEKSYLTDKVVELMKALTGFEPNDEARSEVSSWITKFGFDATVKATEIAFSTYSHSTGEEWTFAFDKIGGICHNITRKTCRQCTHNDGYDPHSHKIRCDIDPDEGYAYKNSFAEECAYYNPWHGGGANA